MMIPLQRQDEVVLMASEMGPTMALYWKQSKSRPFAADLTTMVMGDYGHR